MTIAEVIVKLNRLMHCDDFPLKYHSEMQEIIHSLNLENSKQIMAEFETRDCHFMPVDEED